MSSLQINNQPRRRSSRHAAVIPAFQWRINGYSVRGANAMEKLQNDIKKYCDEGDTNNVEIELTSGGIKLPHHDVMLPHWKRFAIGMSGRNTVKDVRFCGVEIPVSVLDTLILPTFQSMNNLSSLMLYVLNLGNEGFLRLSSFLKKNTRIKQLEFFGDTLDDVSVATSFSDAVKNHPALEHFGFARILGLKNNIILGKVLEGCSRVRALHLMRNTFGSKDVAVLADFISSNHPTELLNLQHNNVSDNDTLLLASALKKNTYLKRLDLHENNITKVGEKTLLKALFDPTTMDSIIESNHTCVPRTYDIQNRSIQSKRMSSYEWELFKIQIKGHTTTIKQTVRRKVVLALCGVDKSLFDLSHFNDLPLQLMPRVLELIQKHTEIRTIQCNKDQLKKDALSRLFHTLRGWELPLLFENLNPKKGAAGKRKRRKTCR